MIHAFGNSHSHQVNMQIALTWIFVFLKNDVFNSFIFGFHSLDLLEIVGMVKDESGKAEANDEYEMGKAAIVIDVAGCSMVE